MFINPKTAIQEGWVTFPAWMTEAQRAKCIQPNALDITADRIFEIVPGAVPAHLSEETKSFHTLAELIPDEHGFVTLYGGCSYDVMSDFYVNVPDVAAGTLTIRSTANRAGMALNSGIWDSGFTGNLGFVMHNRIGCGRFKLKLHTRVCQLAFMSSDSAGTYAGGYNHAAGTHWSEKQQ
jgi:deoxycytidine triphosphate deaminase